MKIRATMNKTLLYYTILPPGKMTTRVSVARSRVVFLCPEAFISAL